MMKKSNFVAMIMGSISSVLFALGMCMALLDQWNAFKPGVVLGSIGAIFGLITVGVWQKMENKKRIKLSGKTILTVLVGIVILMSLIPIIRGIR